MPTNKNDKTECPDCNEAADLIAKESQKFITLLIDKMSKSDITPHMSSSSFILLIINECMQALNVSFEIETAKIMSKRGEPEDELIVACEKRLNKIITALFNMIEKELPVSINSTSEVPSGDVAKVMDFVKALKETSKGKVTH